MIASYAQYVLSSVRHWTASAKCFGAMAGLPSTVDTGARDIQDAVVCAGAEALLGDGPFQQAFAMSGRFAVLPDLA